MTIGIASTNLRTLQLGRIFTPATPVRDSDLFSGRQSLIIRIADAVNQLGMHCILFGERGVGKTSLANILFEVIGAAMDDEFAAVSVTCDSTDDYASLIHKLTRQIVTVQEREGLGFRGVSQPTRTRIPLSDTLPDQPTPNDVLTVLQSVEANWLLILDEFDRIADSRAAGLMADTIKTLSDNAAPATVLIVGVANDVDSLLEEHRSIERCLTQVWMPRMTRAELSAIVSVGLSRVGMEVDEAARWYIPAVSQGYPHYTHLLALHSARQALDNGRDAVMRGDIESAIGQALTMTERSIRENYAAAVHSVNPSALYKQVLLACALAETDEFDYFSAQAVREPLSRIMGRNYDLPAFSRHLDAFCRDERGPTLIKEGQRRRFRYRFATPLTRPFTLLNGIAEGLIQAEVLIEDASAP